MKRNEFTKPQPTHWLEYMCLRGFPFASDAFKTYLTAFVLNILPICTTPSSPRSVAPSAHSPLVCVTYLWNSNSFLARWIMRNKNENSWLCLCVYKFATKAHIYHSERRSSVEEIRLRHQRVADRRKLMIVGGIFIGVIHLENISGDALDWKIKISCKNRSRKKCLPSRQKGKLYCCSNKKWHQG
jgi:hypothetical protein